MSTAGRGATETGGSVHSEDALALTAPAFSERESKMSEDTQVLNQSQVEKDGALGKDLDEGLSKGDLIGEGDRFEILERLGAGGMGMVYRALDRQLNRVIAIKFLLSGRRHVTQEMVELLRREARATAQVNHENIVRIFDLGMWKGQPFLVIEYLEGESLKSLLERGRLPPERAIEILIDVTRGLEHAHWQGIIHRDLKPANVFILESGRAKILDFGVALFGRARAAEAPDSGEALAGETGLSLTAGTPRYMAPEQWRGEPQDGRTDTWAAGVMLYELLCGRHPLGSDDSLLARHDSSLSPEPVPPLAAHEVPFAEQLNLILARALAKDREDRLHCRELKDELLALELLLGRPGAAGAEPSRSAPVAPERRWLTMLACHLGGTAALAEQVEIEVLRELLEAFRARAVDVVKRYQGRVVSYVSGRLLAGFGYPAVHEDDAQRAVEAGLALLAIAPALSHLGARAGGWRPELRVGVRTDVVIIEPEDEGSAGGLVVHGEAPHLAAWLAEGAPAGAVVISERTRLLVRGMFAITDAGMEPAPGTGRPTGRYLAARSGDPGRRFDQASAAGLTPLVGRGAELERLGELWAAARGGHGQVAVLSGEAGIGKSRIIEELRERTLAAGATVLACQCWSHYRHSALYPMAELLRRLLGFRPQQAPAERLTRLEQLVATCSLPAESTVPPLAALLAIPLPSRYPPLTYTPALLKEKTLGALATILLRTAEQRALLFVIEDLHWIDPSTQELLDLLVSRIDKAPILVVLTARPEFKSPILTRPLVCHLQVERLPATQVAEMIQALAPGRRLSPELIARLATHTDGVPLFVEELTRTVLETAPDGGVGDALPEGIPATLHGLLATRLDRLEATEREIAQKGAVLGRSFPYALLSAVHGGDEAVLEQKLRRLCEAGLLLQRGAGEGLRYSFRHALVQDVVYQSLLRGQRCQHHERTARVLRERFPEVAAEQPEVLAYHYAASDDPAAAITYWTRAGNLACQRSANLEAISHFGAALRQVPLLPDAGQHIEEELKLQIAIGTPLMATKGYAAPVVAQTYARARELCAQVGDTSHLFPALRGLWLYYFARAEYATARELAQKLLDLANNPPDTERLVLAHRLQGTNLFLLGEMAGSKAQFDSVRSLYDRERHRSMVVQHGLDPAVAALGYSAWIHCLTGAFDVARAESRDARALADELGHQHTLAFLLSYTASVEQLLGDAPAAREVATQAIALATEQRFGQWLAWSTIMQGWALSAEGRGEQGLAALRKGIGMWRLPGTLSPLAYFLALLADACLRLGMLEDGAQAIEESLGIVVRYGERHYEPEIRRLWCEIALRRGKLPPAEAEAGLREALAIAERQGQRGLALRVQESLAWLASP